MVNQLQPAAYIQTGPLYEKRIGRLKDQWRYLQIMHR